MVRVSGMVSGGMLEKEGLLIRMWQSATVLDYVELYCYIGLTKLLRTLLQKQIDLQSAFWQVPKKNVTTCFSVGGNQ